MFTSSGFTSVQASAVVLLIAGITLRLILNKRRFDRRSVTGLPQFRSYWSALIVILLERLVGLAAFLSIIAGLFLLLIEWYNLSNVH